MSQALVEILGYVLISVVGVFALASYFSRRSAEADSRENRRKLKELIERDDFRAFRENEAKRSDFDAALRIDSNIKAKR